MLSNNMTIYQISMDMKITVGQNTKYLKLSFGILLRIDWYGQSGMYSEKMYFLLPMDSSVG